MREFRCTRNALYLHDCLGRDSIEARQGYYICAETEEAAWAEMARRYPDETEAGFTVEPWERFSVVIMEVHEDGNRPAGLIQALKDVQAMKRCDMLNRDCVITVLNDLGYKTIADWLGNNLDKYIDIIDELLK